MYAIRLETDEALHTLSDIFVLDHVFHSLDGILHSFYGIYHLFRSIEDGHFQVYGVKESSSKILGVWFGREEDETPGWFVVHAAFRRGVDAAKAGRLLEESVIKDWMEEGKKMIGFIGYIPDFNRAAIRMAKREGAEDCGIESGRYFYSGGLPYVCHKFEKRI